MLGIKKLKPETTMEEMLLAQMNSDDNQLQPASRTKSTKLSDKDFLIQAIEELSKGEFRNHPMFPVMSLAVQSFEDDGIDVMASFLEQVIRTYRLKKADYNAHRGVVMPNQQ